MNTEALIPKIGVVTKITQETPDVKTFQVVGPRRQEGNLNINPGQCAMLSVPASAKVCFPSPPPPPK